MLKLLDKTAFGTVFKIMEHSFPLDEHRPYEEQEALLQREQYRIVGAMGERGELAGFMAVWEFPEFLFLEHFAVAETYRNRGMGPRLSHPLRWQTGSLPLVPRGRPMGFISILLLNIAP